MGLLDGVLKEVYNKNKSLQTVYSLLTLKENFQRTVYPSPVYEDFDFSHSPFLPSVCYLSDILIRLGWRKM